MAIKSFFNSYDKSFYLVGLFGILCLAFFAPTYGQVVYADTLISGYSTINSASQVDLYYYTPVPSSSEPAEAQFFTTPNDGVSHVLNYVDLSLCNCGGNSSTANVHVSLYNFTLQSLRPVPTGSPLATSDDVNTSSLTGSYSWIQFNFSSPYTLAPNTSYEIVIWNTNDIANIFEARLDGNSLGGGSAHANGDPFGTYAWIPNYNGSPNSTMLYQAYETAGGGGGPGISWAGTFSSIPSIFMLTLMGLFMIALFAESIVLYSIVFFVGGAVKGFARSILRIIKAR